MGEFEGVILSSNLISSNRGEPEALLAFLFWELLKSLGKAFKSMDSIPYTKAKKRSKSPRDIHRGAAKV